MAYFEIKGVIPPMLTPFTPDGKVDLEAFAQNIERWNKSDLAGYLVLGSNGETPYLTEADKLRLIELTARRTAPGRIVMAGTGMESTAATVALTQRAADCGATCALVLTPSYYGDQMGDEAQIDHFTRVADMSPIPILIYNVTKFTHVNISPRAVATLSRHHNIIGMKDSSGNIMQLMKFITAGLAADFNLIVGTAGAWYPALCIGVKATVTALANCCPDQCVEIQTLFESGWRDQALALYQRMFPVNDCVTGALGVPALKYASERLGFRGGAPCRPLLPLSDAQKKQVDTVLQRAGLLE